MGLREDFGFYLGDKPVHQAVYEALRDAIVTGRIPMGERLIETDYAKIFNVSRTPIRTALQKLERNGLAVLLPGGGLAAKGLSLEGINNMFKFQQALEHLAFPQVVVNITDEELGELLQKAAESEQLLNQDNLQAAHINEDIHRTLFKISRFEGIMEAVDLAYGYVQGFNLMAAQDKTRQVAITSEHRAILEALTTRDITFVTSVTDYHLEACKLYVLQYYQNTLNSLQAR